MARFDLTDFEWSVIQPLLPNKPRGVPRVDDRRVLNGIFWRLRTGAPWADIPSRYGPHTTCVNRFNRWRKAGVWYRLLDGVSEELESSPTIPANFGGCIRGRGGFPCDSCQFWEVYQRSWGASLSEFGASLGRAEVRNFIVSRPGSKILHDGIAFRVPELRSFIPKILFASETGSGGFY